MAHVFSRVFNKILKLLAHITFYSVSAVIGYAAGYKRLKKYNNNNNNNNNNSMYNTTNSEAMGVDVNRPCGEEHSEPTDINIGVPQGPLWDLKSSPMVTLITPSFSPRDPQKLLNAIRTLEKI